MSILEMGSEKFKGGRRYIRLALLTIHDEGETNLNGIHWSEQNVLANLDSIKSMPICAEFTDSTKEVPLGHGYTEQIIDDNGYSQPIFENSEVVGVVESASIETINDKRVLVGEGYLYNQRYPKFVKWVKDNIDGLKSSIEIVGTESNDNHIIYEGEATQSYRAPRVFSFSGSAILSVQEADPNASVLEAASLHNNTEESEDKTMDEKTISLIADAVKNAVTETNAKNAEYEQTITELNQTIAERESKIAELNSEIEKVQAELADAKNVAETCTAEKENLEKEIATAKTEKAIGELNAAIASFTDEQKAFAQAEIDAFNADPLNSEINSVVDKIYAGIGKKSMEQPVAETNSVNLYEGIAQPKSQVGADKTENVSIY